MGQRDRTRIRGKYVEVAVHLAGIPCLVSGIEYRDKASPRPEGIRRLWHTVRGQRSGMFFAPEWLGLRGWLDVELRAEAEYRGIGFVGSRRRA